MQLQRKERRLPSRRTGKWATFYDLGLRLVLIEDKLKQPGQKGEPKEVRSAAHLHDGHDYVSFRRFLP
jgi:hypothetical protein